MPRKRLRDYTLRDWLAILFIAIGCGLFIAIAVFLEPTLRLSR